MNQFNFDCPQTYYDLSTTKTFEKITEVEDWFQIYHNFEIDNSETAEDFCASSSSSLSTFASKRKSGNSNPLSIQKSIDGGAIRSSRSSIINSGGSNINNSRNSHESSGDKKRKLDSYSNSSTQFSSKTRSERSSSSRSDELLVNQPKSKIAKNQSAAVTSIHNKKIDLGVNHTSSASLSRHKCNASIPITKTLINTTRIVEIKTHISSGKHTSISGPSGSLKSCAKAVRKSAADSINGSSNIVRKTDTILPKFSSINTNKNDTNKGNKNGHTTEDDVDKEMLDMLKKHNQRFTPAPAYEPPRHSVREVRIWEQRSGRLWSTLTPVERENVNDEISKLKRDGALVTVK